MLLATTPTVSKTDPTVIYDRYRIKNLSIMTCNPPSDNTRVRVAFQKCRILGGDETRYEDSPTDLPDVVMITDFYGDISAEPTTVGAITTLLQAIERIGALKLK